MKSKKKSQSRSLRERFNKLAAPQKKAVYLAAAVLALVLVILLGRAYTIQTLRNARETANLSDTSADQSLFTEAEKLFEAGEHEQAAGKFQQYADSGTGYDRYHGLMRAAEAYVRSGNHTEALVLYERVIAQGENDLSDLEFAAALDGAARAAEQTQYLEQAQQHNQRHIGYLQDVLEGREGEQRQSVNQLLKAAQEYKAHLESIIKFRESEEARASAEAERERASEEATPESVPRPE